MEKLEFLERKLDYQFKDQSLLIRALTHKSFKKPCSNERLEFLGDAVLDLVVGEFLFHEFQNEAEGDLSKLRAALVNEKSFAKIASSLDLGSFIFMSTSEENNHGRTKPSLLSDALEAIIGAIHLESGFEKAKEIALNLIKSNYPSINAKDLIKDYKTKLQEITQSKMGQTPEYETLRAFGPDHQKQFEISLKLEGKEYSRAIGKTKKEAQQMAAKIALEKLEAL